MPTRVVAAATMKIGKKGGGKHWTAKEKKAREDSASDFERKDGAVITPPIWLSKDALLLWKEKIAQIAGLKASSELLDALDTEMLAVFCDAVVKYKSFSEKKRFTIDDHKMMQTYQLRILGYSERLGFTPGARARLIKSRADVGEEDLFGKKFD